MRTLTILLLLLSLALTGCVIGGGDDDDNGNSLENAETCEDVATYFADVGQDFINDAEDAGLAALSAGMESAVVQEYLPEIEATLAKADELGCTEEEIRPLIAGHLDEFETEGPLGELIVDMLREQTIR